MVAAEHAFSNCAKRFSPVSYLFIGDNSSEEQYSQVTTLQGSGHPKFRRDNLPTSARSDWLYRTTRTFPGFPKWFHTHRISLRLVKVKHLQSKRRLFRWLNQLSKLNVPISYPDMVARCIKSLFNTRKGDTPMNRIILAIILMYRTCRTCPTDQWDQSTDIATQ